MSTESGTRLRRRRSPQDSAVPPSEAAPAAPEPDDPTPVDAESPAPPASSEAEVPVPARDASPHAATPPPGLRLLAAVVLAAIIGLLGGAIGAWAIYQHFGPVERIVSVPTKGNGGSGPTVGQLAQSKASSVVSVATQPVTADGLINGAGGFANGVVVSADGLILTSAHAVQGATRLRVGLADGHGFDATVVGQDLPHGLVVLRAAGASNLTPIGFSTNAPSPGDLAIAVSRPGLGALTLGVGTVSSTGRSVAMDQSSAVSDAFTIDTSQEPQADGAAVIDAAGGLIGIVVVVTQASPPPGVTALSSQAGKALVDRVSGAGHATRASFGADAAVIDPALAAADGLPSGAVIRSVDAAGAAALAGLRSGDIVTTVNGTAIDAAHPFDAAALGLQPGEAATLSVVTGGVTRSVSLVVGSTP